jgi:DNA-nicking Smr family endonuclease
VAKAKPFNNPFSKIKLPKKEETKPSAEAAARVAREKEEAREAARNKRQGLSEEEHWSLAIDGVAPLLDRSGRIKPGPEPVARPMEPMDPELAAYDHLRGLVDHFGAGRSLSPAGGGALLPFDLSDTDEFIEGCVQGLDPRVVKRLRRGDYAVQGNLDLHGMRREEAKPALLAFIQRARVEGKRCVLLVHGRGLHSKDQVPVLKESVRRWLSSARFAEAVLAFATARPHDGGAGAIYLLLRKA